MSNIEINNVSIFDGKGRYYLLDGFKYDINFPLAWALEHHNYPPYYDDETKQTYINGSGPKECPNCFNYGCINGVFVGYCSSCLDYVYNDKRGDHSVATGFAITSLCECEIWKQYPYMDGVKISDIGITEQYEEQIEEQVEEQVEEPGELNTNYKEKMFSMLYEYMNY